MPGTRPTEARDLPEQSSVIMVKAVITDDRTCPDLGELP